MENHDHHHEQRDNHVTLALHATGHCLIGCGLGDVAGMTIGMIAGFSYTFSVIAGVICGLIFGLSLGVLPLLSQMSLKQAAKIVLTTEILSITVMEIAEALTELHFPGMKRSGITHLRYWIGLSITLIAGFLASFPVNFYLVKKGIRHQH